MAAGTIKTVVVERGFGFIAQDGGKDAFFHVSDLFKGIPFDEQLTGRRVNFDIEQQDRGPRARNIRAG